MSFSLLKMKVKIISVNMKSGIMNVMFLVIFLFPLYFVLLILCF